MVNDGPVYSDLHSLDHEDTFRSPVVNELRERLKGTVLHEYLQGGRLITGQHDHFHVENGTENVEFAADAVAPGGVVAVVLDGGIYQTSKFLEGPAGALGGVEGHRHVGDEEQGDVSLVDRHSLKVGVGESSIELRVGATAHAVCSRAISKT